MKKLLLAALKNVVAVPIDIESPRESNRNQTEFIKKQMEEIIGQIAKDLKEFTRNYVWKQDKNKELNRNVFRNIPTSNSNYSEKQQAPNPGYYDISYSSPMSTKPKGNNEIKVTVSYGVGTLMYINIGTIRQGKKNKEVLSVGIAYGRKEAGDHDRDKRWLEKIEDYSEIEEMMAYFLNEDEIVKRSEKDKYEKAKKQTITFLDEVEKLLHKTAKTYLSNDEEIEVERKERSHEIGLYDQDSEVIFKVNVIIDMDGETTAKISYPYWANDYDEDDEDYEESENYRRIDSYVMLDPNTDDVKKWLKRVIKDGFLSKKTPTKKT